MHLTLSSHPVLCSNYYESITLIPDYCKISLMLLILIWLILIKTFFLFVSDATASASDDEDNEFYDAQEEGGSVASQEDSSFILKIPVAHHRRNSNDATGSSSEGEEGNSETQQVSFVMTEWNVKVLLFRACVHKILSYIGWLFVCAISSFPFWHSKTSDNSISIT